MAAICAIRLQASGVSAPAVGPR